MKAFNIFSLGLILLPGTLCGGLPRYRSTNNGDTLPETSKVTAFLIGEDGTPSVECWEITDMINDQKSKQFRGPRGVATVQNIAAGGTIDGLDILTWPSYSPIWPPPDDDLADDIHSNFVDLSGPSLYSVQNGMINFRRTGSNLWLKNRAMDDDPNDYIFNLENGDDWFYFEDSDTGTALTSRNKVTEEPPFLIGTVSSTETEVLRIMFGKRPEHKVLHEGACSFTGIVIPESTSGRRGGLTVNPPFGTGEL